MKTPAAQRQAYLEQVQPYVPEPILAVGFLGTPGAAAGALSDGVSAKAIWTISPLAAAVFRRKQAKGRAQVVTHRLAAVTALNVYLFDHPSDGRAFQVTAQPTVWSRASFRGTADAPGRLTQRLRLEFSNGAQADFEITRAGGSWATFSDAMRDLLVAQPAALPSR